MAAFATGLIIPVQIGVNSSMGRWAGNALAGAAVNFSTGLAFLTAYFLAARPAMAPLAQWFGAPWYYWTGGLMGTLIVSSGLVIAPRIGAATFIGVLIAGQLVGSMALDHFGLLGFPVIRLSAGRILGAVLLLLGVYLIRRG
ncbi:MAG: DMT family transporter [Bryobacter sp.]|nr:DMT family transporter [Bryobacter sp.]